MSQNPNVTHVINSKEARFDDDTEAVWCHAMEDNRHEVSLATVRELPI